MCKAVKAGSFPNNRKHCIPFNTCFFHSKNNQKCHCFNHMLENSLLVTFINVLCLYQRESNQIVSNKSFVFFFLCKRAGSIKRTSNTCTHSQVKASLVCFQQRPSMWEDYMPRWDDETSKLHDSSNVVICIYGVFCYLKYRTVRNVFIAFNYLQCIYQQHYLNCILAYRLKKL